jgi:hypothetical protein
LEGLLGIVVCVGGGKREDEEDWDVGGPRFGSEERGAEGGGIRPGAGRRCGAFVLPDARWAEFSAGKAARRGVVEVVEDARWEEFAAGKSGGCDFEDALSVRFNDGIGLDCMLAEAFGVVGEVGFLIDGGGGGGGIALRSCSTFDGIRTGSDSTICGPSFSLVDTPSALCGPSFVL